MIAINNDNFHQCLRQLKSLKVEKAAEKIINLTGICDTNVINVSQTLMQF
jgi:hypothetical protein